MYLVVALDCTKALGQECDWVPLVVLWRQLREDSACCDSGAISLNAVRTLTVRESEHRCRGDELLQSVECVLFAVAPREPDILLGEVEQRACMMRSVGDEPAVEIGEAHEGLHLFLGRGHRPLRDSRDLDRIHFDTVMGDDDTEVLDTGLLKLALVVS